MSTQKSPLTREEEIKAAAESFDEDWGQRVAFKEGAKWADKHPQQQELPLDEPPPATNQRSGAV